MGLFLKYQRLLKNCNAKLSGAALLRPDLTPKKLTLMLPFPHRLLEFDSSVQNAAGHGYKSVDSS